MGVGQRDRSRRQAFGAGQGNRRGYLPAALVWPYEWAIAGGWALLGLGFYLWARAVHPGESAAVVHQELATGHSDIEEPLTGPA
jgi:hypothetical protein